MKILSRSLFACFLAFFLSIRLWALELPGRVRIDNYGVLQFDELAFQWCVYSPNWGVRTLGVTNFNFENGYLKHDMNTLEMRGESFGFETCIEINKIDETRLDYTAAFNAENKPVGTPAIALIMIYPLSENGEFEVDGRKVQVPEVHGEVALFDGSATSFVFWSNGKKTTVHGNFRLRIQDDREWNSQSLMIRIYPDTIRGDQSGSTISKATLHCIFEAEPPIAKPIDLSQIANRGFCDDTADDGQGGWTDKGPGEDLRSFKIGPFNAYGVDFSLIDPERNNGHSCLVLGDEDEVAQSAMVDGNGNGNILYLLHAFDGTAVQEGQTIGLIEAHLADESTEIREIISGVDCVNWMHPINADNASVAWLGENENNFLGLFISQFEFSAPVSSVVFKTCGIATWMVVAVSQGDSKLKLDTRRKTSYVINGCDYYASDFSGKIVPGSPLDFSGMTDTPAGKFGRITVSPDGHFVFENAPEKRIRLYGPNLIDTANYPPREIADEFAEKAYRLGYNCVRFHHFEQPICNTKEATRSAELDAEMLDKIDYLMAALKKKGIYITLDLFASRMPLPGDAIEEFKDVAAPTFVMMKSLIPVSPSALQNWKDFVKNLLTHTNPYTGLTWAEEPALFSVNLINEGGLYHCWSVCPAAIPIYEERYADYLRKRGMDTPENRADRGNLFKHFISEVERQFYQAQKDYLVNELKCPVLVTNMNSTYEAVATEARACYDFVDNHFYFDHPTFPQQQWRLPYSFRMHSSIGLYAQCPRNVMPQRYMGKPYTLTEFNYCAPNPYRMECGALAGAYAALQDWDGMNRFAWSHGEWPMRSQRAPIGFDIVNDPQGQMAERIVNVLFTRGDVSPATNSLVYDLQPGRLDFLARGISDYGFYPEDFTMLGLWGKIGSVVAGDKAHAGDAQLLDFDSNWKEQLPREAQQFLVAVSKRKPIESSTGEIMLDPEKKAIRIVTPKSEVMCLEGGLEGQVMRVMNAEPYQSIALISLDGVPLSESRRILLLHLVDVIGNKAKFSDVGRTILTSWGTLPILYRKSTADLELTLPRMTVEALKFDGSLNGKIPVKYENGIIRFSIDSTAREGGVMAYLLSAEDSPAQSN